MPEMGGVRVLHKLVNWLISTAINANNSGSSSVDKMQTFDTAFDDKGTNGPSCREQAADAAVNIALVHKMITLHSTFIAVDNLCDTYFLISDISHIRLE